MKKSNRIVSLLLCVALILTQFVSSVVASAEDGKAISAVSLEEGFSFSEDVVWQTKEAFSKQVHTISAWVYLPTTIANRGGVVLGNYKDNNNACYSFEINTDGQPRFYHRNGQNKVIDLKFANIDIRADEWVHLAITVDEENNKVSCYKNGSLGQTLTATDDISLSAVSSSVALGGDLRSGNAQYFKGRILEVSLYENVLTESGISELYANGVNTDDSSLFAYYDLMSATQEDDYIIDASNHGNGMHLKGRRYFTNKDPLSDYAYSFAVVGDTQTVVYQDVTNGTNNLSKIYDWILANKEEKNTKYVLGMGDITDKDLESEWVHAQKEISKLNGEIPYLLNRGNHDGIETFNEYIGTQEYDKQFENGGYFEEGCFENSWITFSVGSIKYLVLALDFGVPDDVIAWADQIISEHPYHNVIVTTHAYLYRDGTTLDANDVCPPTKYDSENNNGDEIWEQLISKHENIVLVLCGHDPYEKIVMTQSEGEQGNTVTQMLIDPQYVDRDEGATGMVAMLYFSEDGKNVQVEYYSTVHEKFFLDDNQFSFDIAVVEESTVNENYNTAREYVTNNALLFGVDAVNAENYNAILTAINTYDAFDLAVKKHITDEEKAKIEARRTEVVPFVADTFKTTHADILAKTVDNVTENDETDLNSALSDYKALDTQVKTVLAEQYAHLKALQHQIVNEIRLGGWDGIDDFSDPDETATLWEKANDSVTAEMYTHVKDGKLTLPKCSVAWNVADYILADGVIAYGDKPVQIIFEGTVSPSKALRFSLFGKNTPIVEYNIWSGGGRLSINAPEGCGWNKTAVTGKINDEKTSVINDYSRSGDTLTSTFTVNYDWTNWANKTVRITLSDADGVCTVAADLTYTGETELTDFNIGIIGGNKDDSTYDSIQVITESMRNERFEIDHGAAWKLDIRAELTEENKNAVDAAIAAYEAITDTEIKAEYALEYGYLLLLQQEMTDEIDYAVNDVNGDGEANIRDLVRMKKYSANEIGKYDATSLSSLRQALLNSQNM